MRDEDIAGDTEGRAGGSEPAAGEDFELPVAGFQGTPDEIERQWFEKVYRGRGDSMAQLTWRAVLMGSLLGGVLSLTNLYIGLKAGWGFGVAITACILSYTIWTGLYGLGLARTKMTILENNCMQSAASAAGYSTGSTLISAFAAYIMINGQSLPIPLMLAWVFFLAVLGVTMAVPMKRQMINVEQLRFPSGIAAAETLRALHAHGGKGKRAAKALGIAGVIAAANQFWTDGLKLIHERWEPYSLGALITKINEWFPGKTWTDRTVMFAWDPIFLAAGALTGLRVSASMFVGGTLCWGVFLPILQHKGIVTSAKYSDLVQWTLWGGVACMVTSGLLAFAFQWRSMLRAFGDLGGMFSPGGRTRGEMDAIETPGSWFLIGQGISLVALVWLAWVSFAMPPWQSALAVVLSFFLALVASRVTGETDTTPIGAMGKVTQLIFGGLNPGNVNVNLMSANITAGAAIASADLLTDLKSGYLLGANPRKQFLAQFSGIFVGTIVTVLSFQVLVPDASVLGTDQFPAPSAQAWKAVALALGEGIESLDPIKVYSMVIGGLVGIILPILSKVLPKKYEPWVPSAAGFGLAWTFHWYFGMLFFLGALIGWGCQKASPKKAEELTFPVASGVIAGGSLMGVLVIFVENGPQIAEQLLSRIVGPLWQLLGF
jgi:putative OPT family oligopeptide transporter